MFIFSMFSLLTASYFKFKIIWFDEILKRLHIYNRWKRQQI